MTTELNLKRVCDLELGDIFNHCNSIYRVREFSKGQVVYQKVNDEGCLVDKPYYFGKNSRQYVDFIKNKHRDKWSREKEK